jgi:hypothetical protein
LGVTPFARFEFGVGFAQGRGRSCHSFEQGFEFREPASFCIGDCRRQPLVD